MNNNSIVFHNVCKSFGNAHILQGLNFSVPNGQWVSIVGSSGVGKTTLLNLISGHEKPTSGKVVTHGKIRTLFQGNALFPWLTVAQNIEMGLRHVANPSQRAERLSQLLNLTGLASELHLFPHELSGGMRQRVQLAWGFATEANLLLMDEPFSSLDYLNRMKMREEFTRVFSSSSRGCSLVLVTHDLQDALQISDRIVVLSERPAAVKADYLVEEPLPRDLTSPRLVDLHRCLLQDLGVSVPCTRVETKGVPQ